jgi:hypothetical protein
VKHLEQKSVFLLYVDAVSGVVGGHVGEDDLVAFFESIEDFDCVDGRTP